MFKDDFEKEYITQAEHFELTKTSRKQQSDNLLNYFLPNTTVFAYEALITDSTHCYLGMGLFE
jgi:hypothetical protein